MIFKIFIFVIFFLSSVTGLFAAEIKVLLAKDNAGRSVKLEAGYTLINLPANSEIKKIEKNTKLNFLVSGNKIKIEDIGVFTGPVLIERKKKDLSFGLGRYRYKGDLLIRNKNGFLWYVNILDVEDYLRGVLPNEISPKWNTEVIKAQAIAARSFAYYIINKQKNNFYDLTANTFSQVYKGYVNQNNVFNEVIKSTKNLVMVYRNQVIESFFHAACGGHTEDAKNVWGKALPYLRGIPCGYCRNSPYYKWKSVFSKTALIGLLNKAGFHFTDIRAIIPARRSISGRWMKVRVIGRPKNRVIQGNKFRIILGIKKLKSTKFRVHRKRDLFEFLGNGWGHGVGMCQWGAKAMAEKGYKYYQILRYYYRGIRIVDINKYRK